MEFINVKKCCKCRNNKIGDVLFNAIVKSSFFVLRPIGAWYISGMINPPIHSKKIPQYVATISFWTKKIKCNIHVHV